MRRLSCPAIVLALSGLPAAAVTLVPDTASAAQCGTFIADEGDNIIFYGVLADTHAAGGMCVGTHPAIVLGNQQAVVCWQDKDGFWRLEDVIGCDSSTPAGNDMVILGAGGDDIVMPVVHYDENEEFICPVPGTSGWLVPAGTTPASYPVLEWYARYAPMSARGSSCVHPEGCSYMNFGVSIQGGLGEDELHGAPSDDQLLSSDLYGDPWCMPHGGRGSGDTDLDACVCATDVTCCNAKWDWDCVQLGAACGADCSDLESVRSDQSQDILCGHGGKDVLMGDEDPDPWDFELMSGGPGAADLCRGIVPPGTSACCSVSSSPGCSDPAIESAVCAVDPFCCTTLWDGICFGEVTTVAGGSCAVGTPPCCSVSSSPGCADDALIEAAVCAADPYCCLIEWDSMCRDEVESVAGASCDPITDVATSSCETVIEASVSATGDGAIARAVCGDDNLESLPIIPPAAAADVLTTYRSASDSLLPSCL